MEQLIDELFKLASIPGSPVAVYRKPGIESIGLTSGSIKWEIARVGDQKVVAIFLHLPLGSVLLSLNFTSPTPGLDEQVELVHRLLKRYLQEAYDHLHNSTCMGMLAALAESDSIHKSTMIDAERCNEFMDVLSMGAYKTVEAYNMASAKKGPT